MNNIIIDQKLKIWLISTIFSTHFFSKNVLILYYILSHGFFFLYALFLILIPFKQLDVT